jgi:hypothetical protein
MFAVRWKISNLLAASRLQFRALMLHVWTASPPVLCWQLAIQTFVIDTPVRPLHPNAAALLHGPRSTLEDG